MGFSRQEYWSGVPLPSPEDLIRLSLIHDWCPYKKMKMEIQAHKGDLLCEKWGRDCKDASTKQETPRITRNSDRDMEQSFPQNYQKDQPCQHFGFLASRLVVHSLSCVRLFATLWTAACQASPVLHHLLEFAQTHVHWVSDDIQPSYPLLPPLPPSLNLSQHQDLFQWIGSSQQMAKVL